MEYAKDLYAIELKHFQIRSENEKSNFIITKKFTAVLCREKGQIYGKINIHREFN